MTRLKEMGRSPISFNEITYEVSEEKYLNEYKCFLKTSDIDIFGLSPEQTNEQIDFLKNSKKIIFLGHKKNNIPVGYAHILIGEKSVEVTGWLLSIFRNKHFGVKFYIDIIEYLLLYKKPIVAKVYEKNISSVKLHNKLGFKVLNEKEIGGKTFLLFLLDFECYNTNLMVQKYKWTEY